MNDLIDVDFRMREAARQYPQGLAIKDRHRSLNWGEFDVRINQAANALLNLGVQPDERVAVIGGNSVAYAELLFGCLRAGACITPLSTLASTDDLIKMINDCGAKYFFVGNDYVDDMLACRAQLTGLAADGIIALDGERAGAPSLELLMTVASQEFPLVAPSLDLGFNLIYSSGTTGTPKGILQDRRFRAQEVKDMIEGFGLDGSARNLVSTPLYSNTTLFLFVSVMAAGGSAVLMGKFNTREFLEISQTERITHAVLVPVQYTRLLKEPDFDTFDLSSYTAKFCTSAPLLGAVKREILDRWSAGGLTEFYGMTEGGVCCLLAAHEHPEKLDTVGQPALGCDLRVVDEKGAELPRGSVGEIVGLSNKMMVGYFNRAEATKEASWYDDQGRRFHRSGDVGWLDEEGFVHLLDRKKDMIISGGFNVYAIDLEKALLAHPDIADAAVIAAPSEQWGETPVAFVVARSGATLDLGSIKESTNKKLGKAQRISEIRLIEELPRSPIGKVLKRTLRDGLLAS